jgi:photosystem II stability/assembly factor-like uncharacterized protein
VQAGSRIFSIIQHPENNRLFAASSAGLYSSNDGGKSWTGVMIGGESSPCRALAIDPFNPNVMYVGQDGRGLFKSSDGGGDWQAVNAGLVVSADSWISDIKIDPNAPDILYAAIHGSGVVKSTNAGMLWVQVIAGYAATGTVATQIIVSKKTSGVLCFGTEAGEIFRSSNRGRSWSPTRQGPVSGLVRSFAAHTVNREMIFAGSESGILVSSDFGMGWKPLAPTQMTVAATPVTAPTSDDSTLYAFGQGVGVQKSSDGGMTWIASDRGLGGCSVVAIATNRSGSALSISVGDAVYAYSATKASWLSANNGLTGRSVSAIVFDEDSSQVMYAAGESGVSKTTNGGSKWSRTLGGHRVHFMDTHPTVRNRVFAAASNGLYASTDKGATWSPTTPLEGKFEIRSMMFAPNNAGVVRVATRNKAVLTSSDGGFTWDNQRYGIPTHDVLAVSWDDKSGQTYFAWSADGDGFRTLNNCLSWDRYSPAWKVGDEVLVTADHYAPSRVFALVNGTDVYFSPSGGSTWVLISVSGVNDPVLTIHWNGATETLYAGTEGHGVYALRVSKVIRNLFGDNKP